MADYIKDPETMDADEYDALQISEWLANRLFDPYLPAGCDGEFKWAHENVSAWSKVVLPEGISINEAKSLMTSRVMFEARHQPGAHNQKSHGRKRGQAISDAEADELAEKVKTDGGFTYDVNEATYRTSGFAVSPYPERSAEIPANSLTGQHIQDYAQTNKDLLDKPDHNLGGWHDTENGTVWLDVSIVKSDKAAAVKVAKDHNQKAIFDLGTFEEIDTGGTGRSARSLEPSAVERGVERGAKACPECAGNTDPANVPVHPGCNCDIVTNSVDYGVAQEELDALIQRHRETGVDVIGEIEVPESVVLDPGTTTVFAGEDFRFGDLTKWLERGAEEYSEDIVTETVFNTIVVEPAAEEVEDEVAAGGNPGLVIVARASRAVLGDTKAIALVIAANHAGSRAQAKPNQRRVILLRRNPSPEELVAAYRIITEG